VTTEEALLRLADSTADAVAGVLRQFGGDAVDRSRAIVVPDGTSPLQPLPLPAVAASVSYVDGVTGGNIFLMNALGARRLATAMMGGDPAGVAEHDGELGELELSAVGEAANQMLAAAAAATASVLGGQVEISPPETRVFESEAETEGVYERATYATSVSFSVYGESCRLVQLVPNAFVVRMTRAFSDLEAELAGSNLAAGTVEAFPAAELSAVKVTLSAELGRARLQLGRAVSLPAGAVVELDREAGEPLDLLVNGRRFGRGSLLLQEDARWAIRIDELVDVDSARSFIEETNKEV
jgi:flagellar motor switch protein FliN